MPEFLPSFSYLMNGLPTPWSSNPPVIPVPPLRKECEKDLDIKFSSLPNSQKGDIFVWFMGKHGINSVGELIEPDMELQNLSMESFSDGAPSTYDLHISLAGDSGGSQTPDASKVSGVMQSDWRNQDKDSLNPILAKPPVDLTSIIYGLQSQPPGTKPFKLSFSNMVGDVIFPIIRDDR